MTAQRTQSSAVVTAMLCAGTVTAQFIGGKAARDALFLAQLDVTSLPTMVIVTSVFSIGLVFLSSQTVARRSPARLVPLAFAASAILLLVEWVLTHEAPKVAAVLVYLHISGLGPMLGSGFWLIASERFDPRTAKRRFGQIAGAGTLGGLLGGFFAERIAAVFGAAAVLLLLAGLNGLCAWQVRRLGRTPPGSGPRSIEPSPDLMPEAPRSGLRVLAEAPYLRSLATLVLLGTISATLVDYLFKAGAVSNFGRGETLLRFFAIYYAATGLMTFAVQTSSSRFLLQRFGLALTTGTPSLGLIAGSVAALLKPGFPSLLATRAAESVCRGSLFRAGYELFYTPIPAKEKRAAKSIVDVGVDRVGDAVGGGIVRLVLLLVPAVQYPTILSVAISCAAVAIFVSSRLNRGYIHSLERSLLNRAVELDLSEVEDVTTRTTMLRALGRPLVNFTSVGEKDRTQPASGDAVYSAGVDPEVQDILHLRSRARDQVTKVLRREPSVTPALVPHVIPLLAWGPVANDALLALRKVADEQCGELVDALISPNYDFAVRRRLARVFSVCSSQRAADGVMLGLDDLRFEVRFHCGRSLSAILERNPRIRIDRERVLEVVLREVVVGRPVWESRRLLDGLGEAASFVDDIVRDRAGQSLAHVFTLLSLVLPREPLQIAFRALHTEDQQLQGTALEYLEGVLPAPIRERLWPFLEDRRPVSHPARPRDEILADLLRSNQSIMLNLEELKRRAGAAQAAEVKPPNAPKSTSPVDSGS